MFKLIFSEMILWLKFDLIAVRKMDIGNGKCVKVELDVEEIPKKRLKKVMIWIYLFQFCPGSEEEEKRGYGRGGWGGGRWAKWYRPIESIPGFPGKSQDGFV